MCEFKIGDKVRRIKPSNWPEDFGEVGKIYTIRGFNGKSLLLEGLSSEGAMAGAFVLVHKDPLEEAKKLLVDAGYTVNDPPKPKTGKVVVYQLDNDYNEDRTFTENLEVFEARDREAKKGRTVIAIVDWTEGQGI